MKEDSRIEVGITKNVLQIGSKDIEEAGLMFQFLEHHEFLTLVSCNLPVAPGPGPDQNQDNVTSVSWIANPVSDSLTLSAPLKIVSKQVM